MINLKKKLLPCKNEIKKILFRKKIKMLKFINKNITFQWVLFLILLALSIYHILTKTQISHTEGCAFLYISFAHLFSQYEYLGKGLIIVVLLLQLLFLQYYFNKNDYSPKTSLLPACFYISILLLTKSLHHISPFFFTLFFLLVIICIEFTESSVKLKNNVFWAGILVALATCFDISSIIIFFLLIATLIINQFSRIKEIGILLFGVALPYFYFFSYHFITNNLNEWILTFQQINIFGVLNIPVANLSRTLFSLIILGIVYLFFIIRFKILSETKVAIQRNRIVTLNTRAVLMLGCILISNSLYPVVLGYLFIHISIYLAMLMQEKSPLFINEVITIITLVALWL